MVKRALNPFHSVKKELLNSGYREYHNKDDARVVEKSVCEDCNKPMHYEGFWRDKGTKDYMPYSYRAFAVCNCGNYQEF